MGSLAVNPVWKFGDRLQRMLAQSSSQWCFFQCRHSGCAISIVWFPLLTLYLCLQTIGISLDCLVIHPMQRAFWMIMCRGALKMEASGWEWWDRINIYIYLSLIDPVIICYIYNWNCTGKYGPGLWSCLQNLLFTCFFTSCVQLFNRLFLDGKSFSKPISHGRGYVPWKEWFFSRTTRY